MKLIEAVIHKLRLQEVRDALDDMGVVDFMETSILCHGQKGQVMICRGARFVADIAERVKLEIISADESVDNIIAAINSVVQVGHREDCRISIRPYLEVT